jgi:ABC-2 type transport system ATP-binding protein
VLVSSHVVNELTLSAEHLVLIARGRLLADVPLADLVPAGGSSLEEIYLEMTRNLTDFTSGSREQDGR